MGLVNKQSIKQSFGNIWSTYFAAGQCAGCWGPGENDLCKPTPCGVDQASLVHICGCPWFLLCQSQLSALWSCHTEILVVPRGPGWASTLEGGLEELSGGVGLAPQDMSLLPQPGGQPLGELWKDFVPCRSSEPSLPHHLVLHFVFKESAYSQQQCLTFAPSRRRADRYSSGKWLGCECPGHVRGRFFGWGLDHPGVLPHSVRSDFHLFCVCFFKLFLILY